MSDIGRRMLKFFSLAGLLIRHLYTSLLGGYYMFSWIAERFFCAVPTGRPLQ